MTRRIHVPAAYYHHYALRPRPVPMGIPIHHPAPARLPRRSQSEGGFESHLWKNS